MRTARLLFDSGANISLITNHLAITLRQRGFSLTKRFLDMVVIELATVQLKLNLALLIRSEEDMSESDAR